jgi:hypothetical protein
MPVAESVIDAARQPFLDVAADIHGSLVYLDAGASEAAQLSLGPSFLLGALRRCAMPRRPSSTSRVDHT